MPNIYKKLKTIAKTRGGYFILIDPEKIPDNLSKFLSHAMDANVDAFLIGGSTLKQFDLNELSLKIKKETSIPVLIFPSGTHQISQYADAILYLSFLQSHDPYFIIGAQVEAVPIVRNLKLETISTAYLLIDSGNVSSAQRLTNVKPFSRNDVSAVTNYSIAAEILGFQFLYLEGGSGAKFSIPNNIIAFIRKEITIPIIVGGGIKKPEDAREKINSGANFVVIGNLFENNNSYSLFKEFAEAIHI
ncbi:MAG: geranylgeranylglyceryl/heptaprenylglyceryl phosphate synthase [Bacteroidetes bacterium]|nr:geranylgeranylglyceryl/heptaprenylglyceryl phosphate synthase [Bacteroidota bacterium]